MFVPVFTVLMRVSVVKFKRIQMQHINESEFVCLLCVCVCASGLLKQQWWWKGPMRSEGTRRRVISALFDKKESQGTREGAAHVHKHTD